jgi:hypothetical protein
MTRSAYRLLIVEMPLKSDFGKVAQTILAAGDFTDK